MKTVDMGDAVWRADGGCIVIGCECLMLSRPSTDPITLANCGGVRGSLMFPENRPSPQDAIFVANALSAFWTVPLATNSPASPVVTVKTRLFCPPLTPCDLRR